MSFQKVIAVDFDGTLCKNEYPSIGEPNWTVIWMAKQEQKNGAILILWTCRIGKLLTEAISACKSWGLTFDYINENAIERTDHFGGDSRKVSADEYWDDRSVTPEMIEARWSGDGKITRQKLTRLKR